MVKDTRANLAMIKERVRVTSHGQMEDNTLESGRLESKMERELTSARMESRKMGSGKLVER